MSKRIMKNQQKRAKKLSQAEKDHLLVTLSKNYLLVEELQKTYSTIDLSEVLALIMIQLKEVCMDYQPDAAQKLMDDALNELEAQFQTFKGTKNEKTDEQPTA
jgi:hypothetical protein